MYQDIKAMMTDMRKFAEGASDPQLLKLMLEIQTQIYDLQEENRALREENHDLKNKEMSKKKVEWKDNAYYPLDDSDNVYCPRCFDKDGELINMVLKVPLYYDTYVGVCPECKTRVETKIPKGTL